MMQAAQEVTFSPASPTDFERLWEMRQAALLPIWRAISPTYELDCRDWFRQAVLWPCMRWIVWKGQKAGAVSVKPLLDKLYVQLLVVHPDYQGWGIGRHAMLQIMEEARAKNLIISLSVHYPLNTITRRFYARLGFREIGFDGGETLLTWSDVR